MARVFDNANKNEGKSEGFLSALEKGYEIVKGKNEDFEIALMVGESILADEED